MSIDRTTACLFVWTDIPQHEEAAFNEWYSREHLRSRVLGAPGFSSGRRLVTERGGPKFVAYYEAEDAAVFSSKPYLELVERPDPLSKHFIPLFRNVIRLVGRKLGGIGDDFCGSVGVMTLDAGARKEEMREWLSAKLPSQLLAQRGVLRAITFETDRQRLAASVRVHTRSSDVAPDFLVLFEATLPEEIDVVRNDLLSDKALAERGGTNVTFARTRLMMDVRPE